MISLLELYSQINPGNKSGLKTVIFQVFNAELSLQSTNFV